MGFQTETGFNTTLSQKLDAGVADATIILASLPKTITEGVMLIGSGTNKEWVYFATVSAGNVQITGCNRGLDKDATSISDVTTTNILSHRVGDPVRLVQHSFSQNNKPDLDGDNTFTGAKQTMKDILVDDTIEFTDANASIRRDTNDLKFKDPNNAEVTLSTLTAAAGADQKVRVSSADTTNGFLEDKYGSGDGLSETITNPAGNEVLTIAVETSDTSTFVKTSSGAGDEDKVPVLNASGQLATGFVDTSAYAPITDDPQANWKVIRPTCVIGTTEAWTTNDVGTGSKSSTNGTGSLVRFTPSGTTGHYETAITKVPYISGSALGLQYSDFSAGQKLIYEGVIKGIDTDDLEVRFGFSTDNDGGHSDPSGVSEMKFKLVWNTASALTATVYTNDGSGAGTDTAITIASPTYQHNVRLEWTPGTSVVVKIDGAIVATITTDIPLISVNDTMTFAYGVKTVENVPKSFEFENTPYIAIQKV